MRLAIMAAVLAVAVAGTFSLYAADQPAPPAGVVKTPAPAAATNGPAGKFKGNPLFNPDFVPIMANMQDLTLIKIYHEAGMNIYSGIDNIVEKPTRKNEHAPSAETLKILSDLGMYAIVDQKLWAGQKGNPTIIAWESPVDEPDNIQDEKTHQAYPLGKYLTESAAFKAGDPTRPFTVCFGCGVIDDDFKGRGIERTEYPKYLAPVDVIQYDVYPVASKKRAHGEQQLELVGQGIQRLRQWTANKKPVICAIETTHINTPDKKPTPAQTACEVWIAMTYGGRGVTYFCHDFTSKDNKCGALSEDKAMLAQLKITNGKLMKVARVVSAPLAGEPGTLKSEGGGKVVASTKKVDGVTVILTVNVLGDQARAVVPVAGLAAGAKIEVLEEGRTITADAGSFRDDYKPYQEHLYKVLP